MSAIEMELPYVSGYGEAAFTPRWIPPGSATTLACTYVRSKGR
jgi:hypothetical protein